jgi:hypothetical protein
VVHLGLIAANALAGFGADDKSFGILVGCKELITRLVQVEADHPPESLTYLPLAGRGPLRHAMRIRKIRARSVDAGRCGSTVFRAPSS